MRHGLKWAWIVLVVTGCAVLPPAEDGEGRLPEDPMAFVLEGKVAWRHPEGRGSANMSWTQEVGDSFRLLLTGPLGQGAVLLESHAGGVRLDTPEGPRYADDADELLAATLGFSVPVAQARYWVLGVPAPVAVAGNPAQVAERDAHGRPAAVTQSAWQIEWSDRRLVDDYALPRRVQLERGDTRLTVVIGAWSLAESGPLAALTAN